MSRTGDTNTQDAIPPPANTNEVSNRDPRKRLRPRKPKTPPRPLHRPDTDTSFNQWSSASHLSTPVRVPRVPASTRSANPSPESPPDATIHGHPYLLQPADDTVTDSTLMTHFHPSEHQVESQRLPQGQGQTSQPVFKLLETTDASSQRPESVFHFKPMPPPDPSGPHPDIQLGRSISRQALEELRPRVFYRQDELDPNQPAYLPPFYGSSVSPQRLAPAGDYPQGYGQANTNDGLLPALTAPFDYDQPNGGNYEAGPSQLSSPLSSPVEPEPLSHHHAQRRADDFTIGVYKRADATTVMLKRSKYEQEPLTQVEVNRMKAIRERYREEAKALSRQLTGPITHKVLVANEKLKELQNSLVTQQSRLQRLTSYLVAHKDVARAWTREELYGDVVKAVPCLNGDPDYEEAFSDQEGYYPNEMREGTAAVVHKVNLDKPKRGRPRGVDHLDYSRPIDYYSETDDEDEQDELEEESASACKRRRITVPERDDQVLEPVPEPVSEPVPEPVAEPVAEPQIQPQPPTQEEEQPTASPLDPPKTPSRSSAQILPPESVVRLKEEENEVVEILSAPIRDSPPPPLPESPLVKAPSPPKRRRNVRTRAAPPPAEETPEPSTPPARRTRRGAANRGRK